MKIFCLTLAASLPLLVLLPTANCKPPPTDQPNECNDSWTATSLTNAPTGRLGHTAVWTGSEMIVWGGDVENESIIRDNHP